MLVLELTVFSNSKTECKTKDPRRENDSKLSKIETNKEQLSLTSEHEKKYFIT